MNDLAAAVAALEARVARLERARLSRADRAFASAVWPVLARSTAGRAWTVAELLREAEQDPALAILRGASGRSVGRLLARCDDVPICGVVVERIGDDRDGAVWIAYEFRDR